MCEDEPEALVGVRRECPLVVGIGEGEQFVASSISAFHAHTRHVIGPATTGRSPYCAQSGYSVSASTACAPPSFTDIDWDEDRCEKEGFETFMLKEIHEQPIASGRRSPMASQIWPRPGTPRSPAEILGTVSRMIIVGCGTSYHAGLAGRMAIERWARIPVEVERGVRVPLPRADRRAGHAGPRSHAVGRDRRHARGDATRSRREARPLSR